MIIYVRVLCLILALLMLVPAVIACKKDEDTGDGDGEETVSTTTSGEGEKSKYDVYDDLGDIDLGGRKVVIAQSGIEDYKNEICVARMTGDLVDDAIFKRTANVEKRLNCEIQNHTIGNGVYSVLNDLESNILSGSVEYDIILNPVYSTCAYTTRGLYRDLNKVDNLDLDDKVYWSKFVNEALEIGGVQYVASGAISLSFYKFTFITAVNDRMLNDDTKGDAPDLIKVVKDGQWTIEYQKNLTAKYYDDAGAPGKDEADTFGFVTSSMAAVDPYVSSGEVTFLKKDDSGYYSWAFDLDKASNVMDAIVGLYSLESTYCVPDGDLEVIAEKFASGTALMATFRLFELETAAVRSMKDKYTILPIPRYSTDQDNYYSLISDRFTGVAIPVTVKEEEIEDIGAVIEAMASESYRTVIPDYYETVLKSKYTHNESSWDMIDMITQNVKMDAVLPYTAALPIDADGKVTVIKLWRSVAAKSYKLGTTTELASAFNVNIGITINEKLNGEKDENGQGEGLQTYIKNQLS